MTVIKAALVDVWPLAAEFANNSLCIRLCEPLHIKQLFQSLLICFFCFCPHVYVVTQQEFALHLNRNGAYRNASGQKNLQVLNCTESLFVIGPSILQHDVNMYEFPPTHLIKLFNSVAKQATICADEPC